MMSLLHAARADELLLVLTRRVRVLTVGQVARTWFAKTSSPCRNARRWLHTLERMGLIGRIEAMAHPEMELAAPVLFWRPDDDLPDFGATARMLGSRWTQSPVATTLVHATPAAAKLMGGFIAGRIPRRTEVTHDIHLAAVYLWYREHRPAYAKRWVSEHEQYFHGAGRNARLPDAIIQGRKRPIELIVEFGGSYSKAKLSEMHVEFELVPYEIW